MAFLDAGGLASRKRTQEKVIERVRSGCLSLVEQVGPVNRIEVRKAVIDARRDKILRRTVL